MTGEGTAMCGCSQRGKSPGLRKAEAEAQDKGLPKTSKLPQPHNSGTKGPAALAAPLPNLCSKKPATADLELKQPEGLPVSFTGKIKFFP